MSSPNLPVNVISGSLQTLTVSRQAGSTDTAQLTNAISAVNATGDVQYIDLEGKVLSIAGVTFNNYTKLQNGKAVRQTGSTNPVLTLPSQASLQSADKSVIRDVVIDGSNKSSGSVGVSIGNHAAVVTQNLRILNEETGFKLRGTQFGDFYSSKAYNCKVGFDVANTVAGGGGNSLLFDSPQAVNNEVGMLFQNVAPQSYPMHSIEIISPQLLSNTLCAIAAVDVGNINIRGFANEYNAGGSTTSATYSGATVKQSSVYLLRSAMNIDGGYIAEATVSPVFLLEDGSHLSLHNVQGYGATGGMVVSADATSTVSLSGDYGCIGVMHGVVKMNVNVISARGVIAATPHTRQNLSLPNLLAHPQAPGFSDVNGTVSYGAGIDVNQGNYDTVQFAASLGTVDSNRIRFQMMLNGSTLIAFNVWASVDTKLSIGIYPNVGRNTVAIKGGDWTRIYWWYAPSQTGSAPFVMFAGDAAGAEVRFAKWHVVTGTDSRSLRQHWNAVLSGDYNGQRESGLAPLVSSGRWTPTAPAGTTNAPTATLNATAAASFILNRRATITGIALEVTTATASSTIRIGLWGETNGLPSFLILDAGTVDSSSTGTKTVTISQELPAGRYYLSATVQGASGPGYRTAIGIGLVSHVNTNSMIQYIQSAYIASTSSTGALPSTFGAIGSVISDAPRFLVQIA